MSDTPRTDAQTWINQYPEYHASATRYVSADFARQLERENAALRKDKERLHRLAYDMAAEMEHHGGEQAFDSAARYWAARAKEEKDRAAYAARKEAKP